MLLIGSGQRGNKNGNRVELSDPILNGKGLCSLAGPKRERKSLLEFGPWWADEYRMKFN